MLQLRPHHDGSELYVSNDAPKLGDEVSLRVRIPNNYSFDHVLVRFYQDSESTVLPLKLDKKSEIESWWKVNMPIKNYDRGYRFLFSTGVGSTAGKY